jgi:hypothetical protein
MSYSVIKSWVPGETLTAAALNTEFSGKITNENDLNTRLATEVGNRTTLEGEHDTLRSDHDTLAANVWNSDHIKENTVTNASMADESVTDTEVAAANKDGVAGTASMRTLGDGELQACAGNDARLAGLPDDSVTPAKLVYGTGSLPFSMGTYEDAIQHSGDTVFGIVQSYKIYIPTGATSLIMAARISNSHQSRKTYIKFNVSGDSSTENHLGMSYTWVYLSKDVSALSAGWYDLTISLKTTRSSDPANLQGYTFIWG